MITRTLSFGLLTLIVVGTLVALIAFGFPPRVPAGLLGLISLFAAIALISPSLRRHLVRLLRGRRLDEHPVRYACPCCGYQLTGVEGVFCPECGTVRPSPIEGQSDAPTFPPTSS